MIFYPHFPFWQVKGLWQEQLEEQKPPNVPEFNGHLKNLFK
jgi:hypothetical protein